MRLHAARDVPGVGADDADTHVRPPRPGRVPAVRPRRQVGEPEPLQHVPVGRVRGDVGGEVVGQRLGAASRPGRAAGPRQDLDRRVDALTPQPPSSVNHRLHRQQRGAGRRGEQRRAARHPGGLAEELDLDAVAGQVAVGEQADVPARRAAARRAPPPAGARPPVSGSTSMPSALAVGDEPVEERLGLSRSATVVNGPPCVDQPEAGDVPVAHVRQREDDAPCRAPARRRGARSRGRCVRSTAATRRGPSSAAGTSPASTARRSAARRRRAGPSRSSDIVRPDDPAQVLAQLPGARAVAYRGGVGRGAGTPAGQTRAAPT